MCECKRHIAILFCCTSLFPVKQVQAFWPVLDFGEIVPIVSNVTTSLNSLSQAKEQLAQLEDSIKAIGESIDTINQFSQDLRENIQDMTGSVNDIQDTISENSSVDADFDNITGALKEANEAQSGLADGLTSQIKDVLDDSISIEEEEEEEISEYSTENAPEEDAAEEVRIGFETVKEESRKVAERVNDSFDASISALNQAMQKSQNVFIRLEKVLTEIENISADERTKLQERLARLKKEKQAVSDRAIAVMEAVKEDYNLEYQDKVADGISNYEKLVNEFLRGKANKEAVFAAGDRLKKEISGINVMPDKEVLDEINRRETKVKEELIILTEDIKKQIRNKN